MVCSAEAIANYWAIVLFAYLTAFGTWAAASLYDFITCTWTSVGDIRRRGQYHLAALLFPMTYMIFYITLQAKSCDYKEMSSAILALLFACVDFLRTVMGLWQLDVFKKWIMSSVRSIESLGYAAECGAKNLGELYETDAEANFDRLNRIADAVRVNDMIVENRLNEGAVRCFVRFRNISHGEGGVYRLFWVLHWVEAFFQLPRLLFRVAISKAKICDKQDLKIFLEPCQPEDIWLRWASALVAQVFPRLLKEMKKSGLINTLKDSAIEKNTFDFAKGILISAAFHTQGISSVACNMFEDGLQNSSSKPSFRSLPHDFLREDMWRKYPDLCRGIFSEQEFLKNACVTGSGLPFGAPHRKAETKIEGEVRYSYSKFETRLGRVREMMTVDDFENLDGFGTPELECLAIILSVENWNPNANYPFDNMSDIVASSPSIEEHDSASGSATGSSSVPGGCEGNATSIATENLLLQLGLHGLFGAASKFMKSFPLLRRALRHRCFDNRNIMEASLHIDNALALCSGDQYDFMVEKEESTTARIVEARQSLGLEHPFQDEIPEFLDSHDEDESIIHTNERERLLYQFANQNPEFSLLDQRMTFLGCSMESLRSSLAVWVENNEDKQQSAWTPRIAAPGEQGNKQFSFSASGSLCSCIGAFPFIQRLNTRYTRMRLILELQMHLHRNKTAQGLSPSSSEAMALCILSFSSVKMTVQTPFDGVEEMAHVSSLDSECTLSFDGAAPPRKTELTLAVPFSPQPIHISVTLTQNPEGSIAISFALAVDRGMERMIFDWEAWRTDYLARQEAVMMWQEEHGLPCSPFINTKNKIDRGIGQVRISGTGTGDKMNVWLGWLPCRPSLSLFEVRTGGYIARLKNVKYAIPVKGWTHLAVNTGLGLKKLFHEGYNDAANADLEHASIVGREILSMIAKSIGVSNKCFQVDGSNLLSQKSHSSESQGEEMSNYRLRLHEAIAVHTGNFSTLRTAVLHLCKLGRCSSSAKRAASMIESFCSTIGNRKHVVRLGCPVLDFSDEALAQELYELFQALDNSTQHAPVIAESMARVFTSFVSYQGSRFTRRASMTLRKAILSCFWSKKYDSIQSLKSVFGSILCRSRLNNHALPMLLAHGGEHSLLSSAEWFDLGETQRSGCNNMLWPALSLDMFCCGILASCKTQDPVTILNGHAYNCSSSDTRTTLYTMYRFTAFVLSGYVQGINSNFRIAKALLQRAVEDGGDFAAMCELGLLLSKGAIGVEQDAPRAVELYSRAINEGGHVNAMFNLGNLFEDGAEGVEKDVPRAVGLYCRAINDGCHVNAMYALGNLLENDTEGIEKDVTRAVQLYYRAIECGGHVDAMYKLANLFEKGTDGVEKNAQRAVHLYARAMNDGGHVGAMHKLALIFRNGADGVEKDILRAKGLHLRAVNDGRRLSAL